MASTSVRVLKKPRNHPPVANFGDADDDDQFIDDRWLDSGPKNQKALDDYLNEPDDDPIPTPVKPAKSVVRAVPNKPKDVKPSPVVVPPPIEYGDDGEPLPWPTTSGEKARHFDDESAYEAALFAPAKVIYATKGRPIVLHEWAPGLLATRMRETNQKRQAYGSVSSLINLFCEVLYWAEPGEMGKPRASGKNMGFVPGPYGDAIRDGERGFYYIRYRRPVLARRLGLSRWAVETAVKKLIELGLLCRINGIKTKYKWLRPNFASFVEYVQTWQADNSARLFKPKSAKKLHKKPASPHE